MQRDISKPMVKAMVKVQNRDKNNNIYSRLEHGPRLGMHMKTEDTLYQITKNLK